MFMIKGLGTNKRSIGLGQIDTCKSIEHINVRGVFLFCSKKGVSTSAYLSPCRLKFYHHLHAYHIIQEELHLPAQQYFQYLYTRDATLRLQL